MSDHKHGEMDTKDHEATFAGFITVMTRTTIAIVIALVLLYIING